MSRIMLLELNELTPPLMTRFREAGLLPNFQRLFDESVVFTTDAEEEGDNLNPWIQWVSVHTGLPFSEHGAYRLGDASDIGVSTITDLVSRADRPVWQCGSMNIPYGVPLNGAALPDPWSTAIAPYPEALEPLFHFVQHQVREHTNDHQGLGLRDYLALGAFLTTHGISLRTIGEIVRQLARERSGRWGWKRVAILDSLMWDVFRWYYRRLEPAFATFFSNSVAHLQHTHWRNLEPEKFALKPPPEEQAEFEEAVLFGYTTNDDLLGRVLDTVSADTTLLFCTALSQQPCTEWDDSGGKRFYRPRDFDSLLEFAQMPTPIHCTPVMSEEFSIGFSSEADAFQAQRCLTALLVSGETAFRADVEGSELHCACQIYEAIPNSSDLENPQTGASVSFRDLLYEADSVKSGVHHPDGMLWIRTTERKHRVVPDRVPLTAIAPTVLSLLGLPCPDHMKAKPLL